MDLATEHQQVVDHETQQFHYNVEQLLRNIFNNNKLTPVGKINELNNLLAATIVDPNLNEMLYLNFANQNYVLSHVFSLCVKEGYDSQALLSFLSPHMVRMFWFQIFNSLPIDFNLFVEISTKLYSLKIPKEINIFPNATYKEFIETTSMLSVTLQNIQNNSSAPLAIYKYLVFLDSVVDQPWQEFSSNKTCHAKIAATHLSTLLTQISASTYGRLQAKDLTNIIVFCCRWNLFQHPIVAFCINQVINQNYKNFEERDLHSIYKSIRRSTVNINLPQLDNGKCYADVMRDIANKLMLDRQSKNITPIKIQAIKLPTANISSLQQVTCETTSSEQQETKAKNEIQATPTEKAERHESDGNKDVSSKELDNHSSAEDSDVDTGEDSESNCSEDEEQQATNPKDKKSLDATHKQDTEQSAQAKALQIVTTTGHKNLSQRRMNKRQRKQMYKARSRQQVEKKSNLPWEEEFAVQQTMWQSTRTSLHKNFQLCQQLSDPVKISMMSLLNFMLLQVCYLGGLFDVEEIKLDDDALLKKGVAATVAMLCVVNFLSQDLYPNNPSLKNKPK